MPAFARKDLGSKILDGVWARRRRLGNWLGGGMGTPQILAELKYNILLRTRVTSTLERTLACRILNIAGRFASLTPK